LQKISLTQQQVVTLQQQLIKQQHNYQLAVCDEWREIEIALYNNNIYQNLLLQLIY
jgi:hypothetical protein